MDRKNYDAEISLEKYHWWYVTRRSILKNICDNYIKNKKELSILEIGCGSGGNLSLLSKYGELYAMESDDFAIKNANSKKICEVRKGMLPDNIPYGKSFDIICLFDVLEHIQDDRLSLQTVNKYLNSDGKIILTVPAYMFLWSGHDIASHHKRRYTKGQIHQLLESTGFKKSYSSYFFSILFTILAPIRIIQKLLDRKIVRHDIKRENSILNYLMIKIFSIESKLLPYFSLPFGVSIVTIADKKSNILE
tara:strand:+ start:81 stop:827 length:747 start_codon:yes stop_codon:yes gene_type:complete